MKVFARHKPARDEKTEHYWFCVDCQKLFYFVEELLPFFDESDWEFRRAGRARFTATVDEGIDPARTAAWLKHATPHCPGCGRKERVGGVVEFVPPPAGVTADQGQSFSVIVFGIGGVPASYQAKYRQDEDGNHELLSIEPDR